MTKEEIWEKLAEEVKLRGFSPLSYYTYKANITTFLDWCDKPYPTKKGKAFSAFPYLATY